MWAQAALAGVESGGVDRLAMGVGLSHVGEFAFVLIAIALQADLLNEETAE